MDKAQPAGMEENLERGAGNVETDEAHSHTSPPVEAGTVVEDPATETGKTAEGGRNVKADLPHTDDHVVLETEGSSEGGRNAKADETHNGTSPPVEERTVANDLVMGTKGSSEGGRYAQIEEAHSCTSPPVEERTFTNDVAMEREGSSEDPATETGENNEGVRNAKEDNAHNRTLQSVDEIAVAEDLSMETGRSSEGGNYVKADEAHNRTLPPIEETAKDESHLIKVKKGLKIVIKDHQLQAMDYCILRQGYTGFTDIALECKIPLLKTNNLQHHVRVSGKKLNPIPERCNAAAILLMTDDGIDDASAREISKRTIPFLCISKEDSKQLDVLQSDSKENIWIIISWRDLPECMRPPPPLKENIREKIWEDGKIKMKPDDPQLFTDLFSVLVSYEKNLNPTTSNSNTHFALELNVLMEFFEEICDSQNPEYLALFLVFYGKFMKPSVKSASSLGSYMKSALFGLSVTSASLCGCLSEAINEKSLESFRSKMTKKVCASSRMALEKSVCLFWKKRLEFVNIETGRKGLTIQDLFQLGCENIFSYIINREGATITQKFRWGIMILSNPAHPIQQEYVWRELLKGMAELECNHDILAGLHDGLEFAKHIQVNFHQPITTKKVLSLITATLRPFNHLTDCLKILMSDVDVDEIMSESLKSYKSQFQPEYIQKMSVKGTHSEVIVEGYQLVKTYYEVWKQVSEDENKLKKNCCHWLSFLIDLVDLRKENSVVQLNVFCENLHSSELYFGFPSVLEHLQKEIKEKVSKSILDLELTTRLAICEAVEFLPKRIYESIWECVTSEEFGHLTEDKNVDLLRTIVKRETGVSHFTMVYTLLLTSLQYYAEEKMFLSDLLSLHVDGMFEDDNMPDWSIQLPETNDTPYYEIANLIRSVARTAFSPRNQEHKMKNAGNFLKEMMKALDEYMKNRMSSFHRLIVRVAIKELLSPEGITGVPDTSLHLPLQQCVDVIMESNNDFPSSWCRPSPLGEFCWIIVAECCAHIKCKPKKLDWTNTFSAAIKSLGKLYSRLCPSLSLTGHRRVIKAVPDYAKTLFTTQSDAPFVIKYLEWIVTAHTALTYWDEKFKEEKFTFDDIRKYLSLSKCVQMAGEAVCADTLVSRQNEIEAMEMEYFKFYESLTNLLFSRDSSVCILPILLNEYNIKSQLLIETVKCLLIRSEKCESGGIEPEGFQKRTLNEARLHANAEYLSKDEFAYPRIFLSMKVDFVKLKVLVSQLKKELTPLKKYEDMFIKLLNDDMFRTYLQIELTRLTSDGKVVSIEVFQSALSKTQSFLKTVILGEDVTYESLTAMGRLDISALTSDLDQSVDVIVAVLEIKDCDKKGVKGIKDMLNLMKHKSMMKKMLVVCQDKCQKDESFLVFENIVKYLETNTKDLTPKNATDMMKNVNKILSERWDSLKLFECVESATDFHMLIQKNFFGVHKLVESPSHDQVFAEALSMQGNLEMTDEKALEAFRSVYVIITQQLQHVIEEYDEQVLNQLEHAFLYILPFMDISQTFSCLLEKIMKLDSSRGFKELQNVAGNMNLVSQWFSQAEGDTLQSVSKDLDCVLESGYYKIDLRSIGVQSNVHLVIENSPNAGSDEKWDTERIHEFSQKLALLDTMRGREKDMSHFSQLNENVYKLLAILCKLQEFGCSDTKLQSFAEPLRCHGQLERCVKESEIRVLDAEKALTECRAKTMEYREKYRSIVLMSTSRILYFHKLLISESDVTHVLPQVVRITKYLFINSKIATDVLSIAVQQSLNHTEDIIECDPMEAVGIVLNGIMKSEALKPYILPRTVCSHAPTHYGGVLHHAPNFHQSQLIRLIIQTANGIPSPCDILHCSQSTNEENLQSFILRTEYFPHRCYIILNVNALPHDLQEVLLNLYLAIKAKSVAINFIETAPSVLNDVPWIKNKNYVEGGPDFSFQRAKSVCMQALKESEQRKSKVMLVYGRPGSGKTYYIRQQLCEETNSTTIAVNEAFSQLNAIQQLHKMDVEKETGVISFNFTMLPPGDAVHQKEQEHYSLLMESIGWFFFNLIMLGSVEDIATGESFHLPPAEMNWKIFVEVPNLASTVNESLTIFCEHDVIALGLFGDQHEIDSMQMYTIDEDARLVYKYLKAYESGRINSIFVGGPSGHATKRLNTGLVPPKGYMDGFPSLGGEEEHPPCPHCFCGPCVIAMPPDFLMGSSAPHERNREQRYKLYRKFWRLMGELGLWKHAPYKRRKTQKTAEDDPREILPECIVKVIHVP